MNEEIKEILNRLEYDKDNVYYVGYTDGVNIDNTLMPKDIKLLLDCMTNLQEELKSANESIIWWTNRFKAVEEENKKLKEENKRIFSKVNDDELLISNAMNYAEAQDYKSRCEKASGMIQFIAFNCERPLTITELNKVYYILQGSDKDERGTKTES